VSAQNRRSRSLCLDKILCLIKILSTFSLSFRSMYVYIWNTFHAQRKNCPTAAAHKKHKTTKQIKNSKIPSPTNQPNKRQIIRQWCYNYKDTFLIYKLKYTKKKSQKRKHIFSTWLCFLTNRRAKKNNVVTLADRLGCITATVRQEWDWFMAVSHTAVRRNRARTN
jgi:hypothetical protein